MKFFTEGNSTDEASRVTTNATGQIVNWSFDFSGGAAVGVLGTFNNGPIDQIDQVTDFSAGNSLASNENVPGSWSLVPEPSTGALLALPLSLLVATRARLRPASRP